MNAGLLLVVKYFWQFDIPYTYSTFASVKNTFYTPGHLRGVTSCLYCLDRDRQVSTVATAGKCARAHDRMSRCDAVIFSQLQMINNVSHWRSWNVINRYISFSLLSDTKSQSSRGCDCRHSTDDLPDYCSLLGGYFLFSSASSSHQNCKHWHGATAKVVCQQH